MVSDTLLSLYGIVYRTNGRFEAIHVPWNIVEANFLSSKALCSIDQSHVVLTIVHAIVRVVFVSHMVV